MAGWPCLRRLRANSCTRRQGVRVFYDEYFKSTLWGQDLYEHLDFIYRRASGHCVIFASKEYADSVWTNHERRSAQGPCSTRVQQRPSSLAVSKLGHEGWHSLDWHLNPVGARAWQRDTMAVVADRRAMPDSMPQMPNSLLSDFSS